MGYLNHNGYLMEGSPFISFIYLILTDFLTDWFYTVVIKEEKSHFKRYGVKLAHGHAIARKEPRDKPGSYHADA